VKSNDKIILTHSSTNKCLSVNEEHSNRYIKIKRINLIFILILDHHMDVNMSFYVNYLRVVLQHIKLQYFGNFKLNHHIDKHKTMRVILFFKKNRHTFFLFVLLLLLLITIQTKFIKKRREMSNIN
jgi:hypothetical protein